ncbi:MAG: hypothetical protein SynsKO_11200 [Synoicihabitans sp.]
MKPVSLHSRCLLQARSQLFALLICGINALSGAPELLEQPQSQNVLAGDAVTLSVSASGEDLTFQWWWYGGKIPGATASTLTIDPVSMADAGSYRVTVSDSAGETIQSAPWRLTVMPISEPTFVRGPTSTEFLVESAKSSVTTIKPLPDGRYYLAGVFDSVNGIVRGPLVRFLADGTVDTTFQSPLGEGASVVGVVLQEDGKLVVGGTFSWQTGEYSDPETKYGSGLIRLNPDGRIDEAFQSHGFFSSLSSISETADGRLLITGGFNAYPDNQGHPIPRSKFAVLHADGSLDQTVVPETTVSVPYDAVQLADGRFLIGGGSYGAKLQCLESDGSLVETFTDPFDVSIGQIVYDLIPLNDGGAIVAGDLGASWESPLWRIDSEGTRNPDFAELGEIPFTAVTLAEPARDGGYWVSSDRGTSSSRPPLIKVDSAGNREESFELNGTSVLAEVSALWEGADGKLRLGGKTNDGNSLDYAVANATNGSLESSSTLLLGAISDIWAIEAAGPSQWWLAGEFDRVNGISTDGLFKIDSAGAIIATYDLGWTESSSVSRLRREADGGLLVAGRFYIARGIPDETPFGTADHLVRITPDGQLDPDFPLAVSSSQYAGGISGGEVNDIARTPAGNLLLMGNFNSVQGQSRSGLAMLTPDGNLDTGFDPGDTGVPPFNLQQVEIDSRGRIYVRGQFTNFGGSGLRSVVRLLPDGSVDPTFDGLPSTANDSSSILVDSNDDLWVGLFKSSPSSSDSPPLVRFRADGGFEDSFLVEGIDGTPRSLTQQPDGKVLVNGVSTIPTINVEREKIVRLNQDGSIDLSFVGVDFLQTLGSVTVLDDGRIFVTRHPQHTNLGAPRFGFSEVGQAPLVTEQPMDLPVTQGADVTLQLVATGSTPLSYQWLRNGVALPGETADSIHIDDINAEDIGDYVAEVRNAFGVTLSSAATLSAADSIPVVTEQPIEQFAYAREAVTLTVTATGSDHLRYQWYRDGVALPGENSATLTLASASIADTGVYFARVTNGLSQTSSLPTRVVIAPTENPGFGRVPMNSDFLFERARYQIDALANAGEGGWFIAGSFGSADGVRVGSPIRVLADGTVDNQFSFPAPVPGTRVDIRQIAVQADGTVLVAGYFLLASGHQHLVRLNSDGTIDPTFLCRGFVGSGVYQFDIFSDGRIAVLGSLDFHIDENGEQTSVQNLAILNPDGGVSTGSHFGSGSGHIRHILVTQDDALLVTGELEIGDGVLARLNVDSTVDESFAASGGFGSEGAPSAYALDQDSQGRIYVLGQFEGYRYHGKAVGDLIRLQANGNLDETFNYSVDRNGVAPVKLLVDEDDVPWVNYAGYFPESSSPLVVRVQEDGTPAPGFPYYGPTSGNFTRNGSIVRLTGDVLAIAGENLDDEGSSILNIDTRSGEKTSAPRWPVLRSPAPPTTAVGLPGNEILVGGQFDTVDGEPANRLARLGSDGKIIERYDLGLGLDAAIRKILRQPDGRLLLLGNLSSESATGIGEQIAQLNADGTPRTEFATYRRDGMSAITLNSSNAVFTLGPDGGIFVTGSVSTEQGIVQQNSIIKLTQDGYLDPTFDTRVDFGYKIWQIIALAIDQSGRIYVGGYFVEFGGISVPYMVRLLPNGELDTAFSPPPFDNPVLDLELDSEGRLIVLGTFSNAGDIPVPGLVRLKSDGTHDQSFSPELSLTGAADQMSISTDQSIYLWSSGRSPVVENDLEAFVVRLKEDGSRDPEFVITGTQTGISEMVIRDDGNPLLLGATPQYPAFPLPEESITPSFSAQPMGGLAELDGEISLSVVARGEDLSYQWRRNGEPLLGATDPSLTITEVGLNDVGRYDVVVSDSVRSISSDEVWIGLAPIDSDLTGNHAVRGRGYVPGRRIVIANTITPRSQQDSVKLQVLLPNGWGYMASNEPEASIAPVDGATQLLEWEWANSPATTLEFDFILQVPTGFTGTGEVVGLLTEGAELTKTQTLMRPDPLRMELTSHTHTADSNADHRLDLSELLRVIELYNTRNGTNRTGRYRPDLSTADGFISDIRSESVQMIMHHHSADTNRDGQLSLSELLRIIELYNTRSGTNRTGAYRSTADTVDGFAPVME